MNSATVALAGIIAAVIGLAVVSILVSRKSNTPAVLYAGTSGLGNLITAATGPVMGSSGTGGLLSNSAGIWT